MRSWPNGIRADVGPMALAHGFIPDVGTPGSSNSFAFHTEIVINEIMYQHKLAAPH